MGKTNKQERSWGQKDSYRRKRRTSKYPKKIISKKEEELYDLEEDEQENFEKFKRKK